ncbi:hypothetical protein [Rhizobium sp. S96]|uniref:hypothetical protein n=1 Tax=Rhizobium sp. S96 TaxID=3055140 RepID=UPI0025AB0628|nr:hypothetical protein [Rhizobium sp. S96]MDM9621123.1 hypothetical protein [Rhizobium sp. S96]
MKAPVTTTERVEDYILDLMLDEGHELDGKRWAKRSQDEFAAELGISISTFFRAISKPPFVRDTRMIEGRKLTLVRLGVTKAGGTDRHQANILSKIWREHMKQPRTSPADYGCICGLVETWPAGAAPAILSIVLKQWPAFMSGVKFEMDALAASGQGKVAFYQWPNLKVIRRFSGVAVELWKMEKPAPKASLTECILSTVYNNK